MAGQHSQTQPKWHPKELVSSASTRIFPRPPSFSRTTTHVETLCDLNHAFIAKPATVLDVFGPMGPLLLSAALISFGWTVWLIVLTIDPNAAANYLMDTAEFDDGTFWLIADPDTSIAVANSIALAALATSYFYAALSMTLWRHAGPKVYPKSPQNANIVAGSSPKLHVSYLYQYVEKVRTLWTDLTGFSGVYRKYWVS